jgi:hypothetical protein
VGDSGTVLEFDGTSWTLQENLGKNNLSSVHFLDSAHGVVGSNGAYYLYTKGTWSSHALKTNVHSVYYVTPERIYLTGSNGQIVFYNLNRLVPNPADPFGSLIIDTLILDSTYTTHSINSIYFLNRGCGFAAGDSGSSFVTYDSGVSWAPMSELSGSARNVNFYGITGHAIMDNLALNYEGGSHPNKGIIVGRITYGNPPVPILGAIVQRIYESDSFTNIMDMAYTSDQRFFLFAGTDTFFHYQYVIHFTDSGIQKTHTFANVSTHPGEIVNLNYNDYAPPVQPPDSILAVTEGAVGTLSLDVSVSGGFANIRYSVPDAGVVRISVQDVLGRAVRDVIDGFTPSGSYSENIPIEELFSGAYYITLTSSDGSMTRKFEIVR